MTAFSLRMACLLCAAALLFPGAAHAAASQQVGSFKVGATEFLQFRVAQPDGPDVEYFISRTKRPSALILFIQGSGCAPMFLGLDSGKRSSNVYSYIDWGMAGNYAVMVVNKPYVPKEQPPLDQGATPCPRQFNDYFSLDNWVRDLRLALGHARQLPWVDARRMLALGVSEGATVATALAAGDNAVTDVALLGGSGPSQFYDFVVNAYKAAGSDGEVHARLDELDATRKRIFAKPDSTTDFAWGHTFKRWSSFFRASSTNNLLKSRARVYLVSGMQDASVPILSTESMASELLVTGRDLTLRRVPNGEHNLLAPGTQGDGLEPEYRRILAWFEQAR
jgi:pimeloyl-ACP methyl ester carboxylesterase